MLTLPITSADFWGLSWRQPVLPSLFRISVLPINRKARIRQSIIKAIPLDLKLAIVAGIGAFIAIIGLKNAGIVVANPATLIGLGDLTKPEAYLTISVF